MKNNILLKQSVIIVGMAWLMAGCGATGDLGFGIGGGDTSSDAGVNGATANANAPYMILDLVTGQSHTEATISDLESSATYRTTSMVFRRVSGSAGQTWMGVFEVTQYQWKLIAGTSSTPWTSVPAAVYASTQDASGATGAAAAVGDEKPASNLSYNIVDTKLTTYNAAKNTRLAIPTNAQWTDACAAGTATSWSWGTAEDVTTVSRYAIVRETKSSLSAPRSVGERSANPGGLYDMHGNVWELTVPAGSIRGGSWYDTLEQAKTNNDPSGTMTGLDGDSVHVLFGVRLVLRP